MATKKKKSSVKKKSLKQRMREKKEAMKKKTQRSNIIRQKDEGTMRVRILPVKNDEEFIREVIQFWLGGDHGSVLSAETFDEQCGLMEGFQELKQSGVDKDVIKKVAPRSKYVMPVLVYKDKKGKKVDETLSGKLMQITNGLGQEIIDLFLDEDEWGDMTDLKDGYDLKITREGTGKTDTSYTVQPCKNSPVPKKWRKEVDIIEMLREESVSYEESLELAKVLFGMDEDEDEGGKKKKKKKSKKSKLKSKKKKKKRNKDI